jgi:hypothetical protein
MSTTTCTYCTRPVAELAPEGPIVLDIRDPQFNPDGTGAQFCCWSCTTNWLHDQINKWAVEHNAQYLS